jgi:hypothetical protein
MHLIDIVQEAHKADNKNKLVIAAFESWQVIEAMKGMISESKPTKFGDYLKKIGLSEKDPIDKATIEQQKKQALSTAEEIKNMDRPAKKGGS